MQLKRYILSFSIAFLFFIPAKAQLLEWDWAQNGGGNSQGGAEWQIIPITRVMFMSWFFFPNQSLSDPQLYQLKTRIIIHFS